jgi:hypothetical protein
MEGQQMSESSFVELTVDDAAQVAGAMDLYWHSDLRLLERHLVEFLGWLSSVLADELCNATGDC